MDDTPHFWSACPQGHVSICPSVFPAERSGDGSFAVPQHRAKQSKAGSRFACPRTPKPLARQPNVAHPAVPSVCV